MTLREATLEKEGYTVLHKINLDITPGSSTVIFGRSGSGKTTLLKSMAGLVIIDDGEVQYNQKNIAKMKEDEFFQMQAHSGFVFQDAALWANRTLYENLAIPLRILKPHMPKEEVEGRIESAVKMVGFRENLHIRPAAVSTGEKKIVSFLRALMTDPEVLFLDEPTASLDKKNISRINSVIRELKKENKTIITVTHDFALTSAIADHIVIIDEGRIVKSGGFTEVIESEDSEVSHIIKEMKGQV